MKKQKHEFTGYIEGIDKDQQQAIVMLISDILTSFDLYHSIGLVPVKRGKK
jgi:hypothetical protein